MNQSLNAVKAFYARNRWYIVFFLGMLLLLQVCSRGGKVTAPQQQDSTVYEQPSNPQDSVNPYGLQPITRPTEKQDTRQQPGMIYLIGLTLASILFYIAMRKQWLQKLMPSFVWISFSIKKERASDDKLAQITIFNRTKHSLTFTAPVVVFKALGQKSRQFMLKTGDQFPITLTPGTSYRLTISLTAFKQKAGLKASYNWQRVLVGATNGKTYASLWKRG